MISQAEVRRWAILQGWASGHWPSVRNLRDKLKEALAERGVDLEEYLAGAEPGNLWRDLFEEMIAGDDGSDQAWVKAINQEADDLARSLDRHADAIADEVAGLTRDMAR